MWKYLAKALGEKSGASDREADIVAMIRLVLIIQAIVTNMVIVAGVIRHWS